MLKLCLLFLATLAVAHGLGGIVGRKQTVTVVGKLTCNGQAVKDVKIKLYEDGTGEPFFFPVLCFNLCIFEILTFLAFI